MISGLLKEQNSLGEFKILWVLSQIIFLDGPYLSAFQTKEGNSEEIHETEQDLESQYKDISM